MIAPQCQQPASRLRQLLSGQLTAAVAADVTNHLEQCESCRKQLETLAADDSWWQEAKAYLSSDNVDAGAPAVEDAGGREPAAQVVEPFELVSGFLGPPLQESAIGRLDDYDILEVIGCGGMGIVFKGYDSQLDRHVAVKVLAPHYATNAAARRRFAREAQAAAAVVHPHVLAIHGVNGNSRLPYLVMPLVAGPSLQQQIDATGPFDTKDVLRIGMQAAQGLAAAHAQGLVHRDIKPANILLENAVGRVLLTDFGLARAIDDVSLTHSGVIAGTPQYMSPEQARGEAVDHRTDLFSLGSVLYTMCAGRPPFRAETTLGVMRRICDDGPRELCEINPDVPPWLSRIITRLLAKDREHRFQSADEVADLLGQFLAHVQHPTAVPAPKLAAMDLSTRPNAHSRLGRSVPFAAVVAVACAATALVVANWPPRFAGRMFESHQEHVATQRMTDDANPAHGIDDGTSGQPQENLRWDDGLDQQLNEISSMLQQLDQELDF